MPVEPIGSHGYLGPFYVGPSGIPPAVTGGATAVMGIDSTSLPPTIEIESGHHEQHSDTLRLLPHDGWQSLNPAKGSVHAAKPLASIQAAAPAIPDYVAVWTIVLVVCMASGVWIARYLVRPIVALGRVP